MPRRWHADARGWLRHVRWTGALHDATLPVAAGCRPAPRPSSIITTTTTTARRPRGDGLALPRLRRRDRRPRRPSRRRRRSPPYPRRPSTGGPAPRAPATTDDEHWLGYMPSREACIEACDADGYDAMAWDMSEGECVCFMQDQCGCVDDRRLVLVRRQGRVRAPG